MTSNHLKNGFWLWTAVCVLLWVLSKRTESHHHADLLNHIATLGMWGGTAIFLVTLGIASYIERSRAGRRVNELHSRLQSGATVEIRGASGLVRLVASLTLAGLVVTALIAQKEVAFYWLRLSLLVGGIALLTFHELLTIIPLLRQPVLRLTRETLESPLFGKLSWRDIDAVELHEVRFRFLTLQHRLHLSVARLPLLTQQLHPATRLQHRIRSLFRPNDQLHLRLIRTSQLPKVIHDLCHAQARNARATRHNP